jgi:F-type H+-transporting ATPase subunit b
MSVGRRLAALSLAVSVCAGMESFARAEEPQKEAVQDQAAGAAHEEEGSGEFNWAYGFVGEKEGVEPGLVYRPKGMAPPFLANLFNAAIFFGVLLYIGKKPVAQALHKRKERTVAGMEEAAKMKADAERRLAEYEAKLANVDAEIERIHREMREAAEAEQHRILTEAKERRERMERDARLIVEQESKAAREQLVRETVATALRSAQALLAKDVSPADHERIAAEHLEAVGRGAVAGTSSGGAS